MRTPGHQSKFGNYFARNGQSKNGFPAALTELRFLYKTFSQQQDLPYRVVHEKHHVAGRKVFRASAGDHLFENRTWQARNSSDLFSDMQLSFALSMILLLRPITACRLER